VDFFSLRTLNENHELRLTKPHLWGILLVQYPETLQAVLLFETLSIYHFDRVIPRLFPSIAHSCSTLSKTEVIQCNFEGILDSLVAIDCFQWHHLDCYLLGAYLTLHSLNSPHASLTLHWPLSSTLFVVLTLIDSVAPFTILVRHTCLSMDP
jgi:hypothetical protein